MADDKLILGIDLDKASLNKATKTVAQKFRDPQIFGSGISQNIEKEIRKGATKGAQAANNSLKGISKNIGFANQGMLGLLGSFTKFGLVLKTVNFAFNKVSENINRASKLSRHNLNIYQGGDPAPCVPQHVHH
mgnify:CR=1 FL=1